MTFLFLFPENKNSISRCCFSLQNLAYQTCQVCHIRYDKFCIRLPFGRPKGGMARTVSAYVKGIFKKLLEDQSKALSNMPATNQEAIDLRKSYEIKKKKTKPLHYREAWRNLLTNI